jgi:hypothetical protein
MIGRKKLSTIREELRKSFWSRGAGPIEWLGKQIAATKRNRRQRRSAAKK